MYIKIKHASQIDTLVDLANKIWTEHFGPMFSPQELRHLIRQVQSKEAIFKQIGEGTQYFFIVENDYPVGYFAYKLKEETNEVFLSKLYIVSNHRRKGYGRKIIEHLESIAKNLGATSISLTVLNKNSVAIQAYEKTGFKNKGIIKRDFGNGLLCDDYKMVKALS